MYRLRRFGFLAIIIFFLLNVNFYGANNIRE
jgi:nitrate reductase NapE component